MKRLDAKRCLVTGGSRGLGLAIAESFAKHGAKVAITYSKNDADAEDAKAKLGPGALVFKGSVADAAHATATIAEITRAWGGLDVLVNNAGVNQVLPIALLEERDWDLVMDVNVKGTYLFSRAALKTMIKQKKGHVLSIGTFASERVIEAPVHYAAAKAALRGFTDALAREVGRYGVQVNMVSPGLLDVGLARMLPQHRIEEYRAQAALGRTGTAEEIADAISFVVSDANPFMTGAKLVMDGGV